MIEVNKDIFIEAIKILEVVPRRAGIESSDYVRVSVSKGEIEMALASSVSGLVKVPIEGEVEPKIFFVDRRLLVPFVLIGRNSTANFLMDFEPTKWIIKHGKRIGELSMKSMAVAGYGVWKDIEKVKKLKLSEKVRRMLVASTAVAGFDASMQHLSCVYLGGSLLLAANKTMMFIGEKETDNLKFPFPIGIIPLLENPQVKKVSVMDNLVILDCGIGYIEAGVSAVAKNDFPKEKLEEKIVMARKWPLVAKLSTKRLVKSFGRMVEYAGGVKRQDWWIKLELGNKKVKMTISSQQGKFEEVIAAEGADKVDVVEWPLDDVYPVLVHMSTIEENDIVAIHKDKEAYLLKGENIELIVARKGQIKKR